MISPWGRHTRRFEELHGRQKQEKPKMSLPMPTVRKDREEDEGEDEGEDGAEDARVMLLRVGMAGKKILR